MLNEKSSVYAEIRGSKPSIIVTTSPTLKNLLVLSNGTSNDNESGITTTEPCNSSVNQATFTSAKTHNHDDFNVEIETLGINTYNCSKWEDKERNALLSFIQDYQSIQRVDILVSNGDVKDSPAPTRSFLFALSTIHAATHGRKFPTSSNPPIKLILDMYSLRFFDAAHFISYASCVEVQIRNLFQQKPAENVVKIFLQATQSLKQQSNFTTVEMFNPNNALVIHNLDKGAVHLLSQSILFFENPPEQLKLYVKKLHPGGLRGLADFLREEKCPIQTLYLDIDGKIPNGSDSTSLHSVLEQKKLLVNPSQSLTDSNYTFPITSVFLQADRDGCQIVVSPDVLTQRSKYFQALFSGRFGIQNNETYIVKLPDCDGCALQALVTFLRYGQGRRLDIPDSTFYNNKLRFQAMAMLSHLAQYFLIDGLIEKVYELLCESLKRFPDAAFAALKIFRQFKVPDNFEELALNHIQFAEVQLLQAFVSEFDSISWIQELCEGNIESPTFSGRDIKKVKARYSKGLKTFLERLEEAKEAGYLDPKIDLITPKCQAGFITSQAVQDIRDNNKGGNAPAASVRTNRQVLILILVLMLASMIVEIIVLWVYMEAELANIYNYPDSYKCYLTESIS